MPFKRSLPAICSLICLLFSASATLACACCADPGFYHLSTVRPARPDLDMLEDMRFGTASEFYMSAAGFDNIRGLDELRKDEAAGRSIDLNVVETFGRHRRIAFPYRAIEKLRAAPPAERSAEGKLTYVTHLFPNAMLATFPGRRLLVVLEPLDVGRTRGTTWVLSDREVDDAARAALAKANDLVDAGAAEDREAAAAIQRSIASGANEFFEFGRCEAAIGHFHRTLAEALAECR